MPKLYLTLGAVRQREHDVGAVNARKLGQNGAGRIPQAGTRLPLLERFPQHISKSRSEFAP